MAARKLYSLLVLLSLASLTFAEGEPAEQISYPKEAFGFVVLNVTDLEKSAAFYRAVLGLREHLRYEAEGVSYVLLDVPGNVTFPRLALARDRNRKEPYTMGDAFSRCTFFVPDMEAVLRQAALAKVAVAFQADEKEIRLRVATLKDPDGYTIEVLQRY